MENVKGRVYDTSKCRLSGMTQDERWMERYQEVQDNKRNPIPEQAHLPVAFHGIGLRNIIC